MQLFWFYVFLPYTASSKIWAHLAETCGAGRWSSLRNYWHYLQAHITTVLPHTSTPSAGPEVRKTWWHLSRSMHILQCMFKLIATGALQFATCFVHWRFDVYPCNGCDSDTSGTSRKLLCSRAALTKPIICSWPLTHIATCFGTF